jgi:ABC-type oligopeptide transport system ATPase subunit
VAALWDGNNIVIALDDIDFPVSDGQIVAVVAPSGF